MSADKNDFYLVKSEFSIVVYFLYIVLVVFAGFATFRFIPQMINSPELKGVPLYILLVCFGIFDIFALFHPLNSCYNVFYDGEYLTYKWTFIPRSIKIHAEKVDGFYTMKVPSRHEEYLTAYPVSEGRILPAISSFYFDNYDDIIKQLPGEEITRIKFSWSRYFNMAVLGKKPD